MAVRTPLDAFTLWLQLPRSFSAADNGTAESEWDSFAAITRSSHGDSLNPPPPQPHPFSSSTSHSAQRCHLDKEDMVASLVQAVVASSRSGSAATTSSSSPLTSTKIAPCPLKFSEGSLLSHPSSGGGAPRPGSTDDKAILETQRHRHSPNEETSFPCTFSATSTSHDEDNAFAPLHRPERPSSGPAEGLFLKGSSALGPPSPAEEDDNQQHQRGTFASESSTEEEEKSDLAMGGRRRSDGGGSTCWLGELSKNDPSTLFEEEEEPEDESFHRDSALREDAIGVGPSPPLDTQLAKNRARGKAILSTPALCAYFEEDDGVLVSELQAVEEVSPIAEKTTKVKYASAPLEAAGATRREPFAPSSSSFRFNRAQRCEALTDLYRHLFACLNEQDESVFFCVVVGLLGFARAHRYELLVDTPPSRLGDEKVEEEGEGEEGPEAAFSSADPHTPSESATPLPPLAALLTAACFTAPSEKLCGFCAGVLLPVYAFGVDLECVVDAVPWCIKYLSEDAQSRTGARPTTEAASSPEEEAVPPPRTVAPVKETNTTSYDRLMIRRGCHLMRESTSLRHRFFSLSSVGPVPSGLNVDRRCTSGERLFVRSFAPVVKHFYQDFPNHVQPPALEEVNEWGSSSRLQARGPTPAEEEGEGSERMSGGDALGQDFPSHSGIPWEQYGLSFVQDYIAAPRTSPLPQRHLSRVTRSPHTGIHRLRLMGVMDVWCRTAASACLQHLTRNTGQVTEPPQGVSFAYNKKEENDSVLAEGDEGLQWKERQHQLVVLDEMLSTRQCLHKTPLLFYVLRLLLQAEGAALLEEMDGNPRRCGGSEAASTEEASVPFQCAKHAAATAPCRRWYFIREKLLPRLLLLPQSTGPALEDCANPLPLSSTPSANTVVIAMQFLSSLLEAVEFFLSHSATMADDEGEGPRRWLTGDWAFHEELHETGWPPCKSVPSAHRTAAGSLHVEVVHFIWSRLHVAFVLAAAPPTSDPSTSSLGGEHHRNNSCTNFRNSSVSASEQPPTETPTPSRCKTSSLFSDIPVTALLTALHQSFLTVDSSSSSPSASGSWSEVCRTFLAMDPSTAAFPSGTSSPRRRTSPTHGFLSPPGLSPTVQQLLQRCTLHWRHRLMEVREELLHLLYRSHVLQTCDGRMGISVRTASPDGSRSQNSGVWLTTPQDSRSAHQQMDDAPWRPPSASPFPQTVEASSASSVVSSVWPATYTLRPVPLHRHQLRHASPSLSISGVTVSTAVSSSEAARVQWMGRELLGTGPPALVCARHAVRWCDIGDPACPPRLPRSPAANVLPPSVSAGAAPPSPDTAPTNLKSLFFSWSRWNRALHINNTAGPSSGSRRPPARPLFTAAARCAETRRSGIRATSPWPHVTAMDHTQNQMMLENHNSFFQKTDLNQTEDQVENPQNPAGRQALTLIQSALYRPPVPALSSPGAAAHQTNSQPPPLAHAALLLNAGNLNSKGAVSGGGAASPSQFLSASSPLNPCQRVSAPSVTTNGLVAAITSPRNTTNFYAFISSLHHHNNNTNHSMRSTTNPQQTAACGATLPLSLSTGPPCCTPGMHHFLRVAAIRAMPQWIAAHVSVHALYRDVRYRSGASPLAPLSGRGNSATEAPLLPSRTSEGRSGLRTSPPSNPPTRTSEPSKSSSQSPSDPAMPTPPSFHRVNSVPWTAVLQTRVEWAGMLYRHRIAEASPLSLDSMAAAAEGTGPQSSPRSRSNNLSSAAAVTTGPIPPSSSPLLASATWPTTPVSGVALCEAHQEDISLLEEILKSIRQFLGSTMSEVVEHVRREVSLQQQQISSPSVLEGLQRLLFTLIDVTYELVVCVVDPRYPIGPTSFSHASACAANDPQPPPTSTGGRSSCSPRTQSASSPSSFNAAQRSVPWRADNRAEALNGIDPPGGSPLQTKATEHQQPLLRASGVGPDGDSTAGATGHVSRSGMPLRGSTQLTNPLPPPPFFFRARWLLAEYIAAYWHCLLWGLLEIQRELFQGNSQVLMGDVPFSRSSTRQRPRLPRPLFLIPSCVAHLTMVFQSLWDKPDKTPSASSGSSTCSRDGERQQRPTRRGRVKASDGRCLKRHPPQRPSAVCRVGYDEYETSEEGKDSLEHCVEEGNTPQAHTSMDPYEGGGPRRAAGGVVKPQRTRHTGRACRSQWPLSDASSSSNSNLRGITRSGLLPNACPQRRHRHRGNAVREEDRHHAKAVEDHEEAFVYFSEEEEGNVEETDSLQGLHRGRSGGRDDMAESEDDSESDDGEEEEVAEGEDDSGETVDDLEEYVDEEVLDDDDSFTCYFGLSKPQRRNVHQRSHSHRGASGRRGGSGASCFRSRSRRVSAAPPPSLWSVTEEEGVLAQWASPHHACKEMQRSRGLVAAAAPCHVLLAYALDILRCFCLPSNHLAEEGKAAQCCQWEREAVAILYAGVSSLIQKVLQLFADRILPSRLADGRQRLLLGQNERYLGSVKEEGVRRAGEGTGSGEPSAGVQRSSGSAGVGVFSGTTSSRGLSSGTTSSPPPFSTATTRHSSQKTNGAGGNQGNPIPPPVEDTEEEKEVLAQQLVYLMNGLGAAYRELEAHRHQLEKREASLEIMRRCPESDGPVEGSVPRVAKPKEDGSDVVGAKTPPVSSLSHTSLERVGARLREHHWTARRLWRYLLTGAVRQFVLSCGSSSPSAPPLSHIAEWAGVVMESPRGDLGPTTPARGHGLRLAAGAGEEGGIACGALLPAADETAAQRLRGSIDQVMRQTIEVSRRSFDERLQGGEEEECEEEPQKIPHSIQACQAFLELVQPSPLTLARLWCGVAPRHYKLRVEGVRLVCVLLARGVQALGEAHFRSCCRYYSLLPHSPVKRGGDTPTNSSNAAAPHKQANWHVDPASVDSVPSTMISKERSSDHQNTSRTAGAPQEPRKQPSISTQNLIGEEQRHTVEATSFYSPSVPSSPVCAREASTSGVHEDDEKNGKPPAECQQVFVVLLLQLLPLLRVALVEERTKPVREAAREATRTLFLDRVAAMERRGHPKQSPSRRGGRRAKRGGGGGDGGGGSSDDSDHVSQPAPHRDSLVSVLVNQVLWSQIYRVLEPETASDSTLSVQSVPAAPSSPRSSGQRGRLGSRDDRPTRSIWTQRVTVLQLGVALGVELRGSVLPLLRRLAGDPVSNVRRAVAKTVEQLLRLPDPPCRDAGKRGPHTEGREGGAPRVVSRSNGRSRQSHNGLVAELVEAVVTATAVPSVPLVEPPLSIPRATGPSPSSAANTTTTEGLHTHGPFTSGEEPLRTTAASAGFTAEEKETVVLPLLRGLLTDSDGDVRQAATAALAICF